ncbi:SipW-dependent-type signal peptide-containing protein [Microbacterium sp. NPDC055665]
MAGTWSLAVATLVVAAVAAVPGSLALWNDVDSVDAGTITTGSINAAIAAGTTVPTSATSVSLGDLNGMIPGETRGATFTVRNTGNVDFQLLAHVNATTSPYLGLSITEGACASTPPVGTSLSSTPVEIGPLPFLPSTNVTFCLGITLSESTPAAMQGTLIGSYSIDLTARTL